MDDIVLGLEGINKSFGGLRAVTNVSFHCRAGQRLGLIGPNGAGKTTIFNMISGLYRTDHGRIWFCNREITNQNPARIAQFGVARTFQVPRTFNNMTVEENLQVAAVRMHLPTADVERRISMTLEAITLADKRFQRASDLSGGERQLLQFARATMVRPKMLILDEPFAGASSGIIDIMIEQTNALAQSGVACLVISHDILSLPRVCEDVVVLTEGSVLTQGTLAEVREDPRVMDAYLGT